MNAFEIPTRSTNERFGVALSGVTYTLTLIWRATTWVLDIATVGGAPIISGIPLVTGADLLAQYPEASIPGGLVVVTDGADDQPTFDGLGSSARLYYVTL